MRRIISLFVPLILSFLFISNVYAEIQRIYVDPDSQLSSQFVVEDAIYVISTDLDLSGETLFLPHNSTLLFKGGKIRNGLLVSEDSRIQSRKRLIFENVTCFGNWKNEVVYSEWFPFQTDSLFDNRANFINLMNLCNGEVFTHLYMQAGIFYCSVKKNSSFIVVPSNVYWHNNATICQLPSEFKYSALVLISNAENIIIDGGDFVGDVKTHLNDEGEWGHGIKLAGAKNTILKNLTCREFWGDGIDLVEAYDRSNQPTLNCSNIVLKKVVCKDNRRQGLSIESGHIVRVTHSSFINTGSLKRTAPGSGIDIEPWNTINDKISRITIVDCDISQNWGPDLQLYSCYKQKSSFDIKQIIVRNCRFDTSYIHNSDNVLIHKSSFVKQPRVDNSNSIDFEKCKIDGEDFKYEVK